MIETRDSSLLDLPSSILYSQPSIKLMPVLELPHTAGCFVCGRDNPLGLRLCSFVDPDTGNVQTTFTPQPHHIGFDNITHGGILATLLDELMVWSAIWVSRKACVAGELTL